MRRPPSYWRSDGSMVGMIALVFVVIVGFTTMAVDICRTLAPSASTLEAQLDSGIIADHETARAQALKFAAGREQAQASLIP